MEARDVKAGWEEGVVLRRASKRTGGNSGNRHLLVPSVRCLEVVMVLGNAQAHPLGLKVIASRVKREISLWGMRVGKAFVVVVVAGEASATTKRFDRDLALGLFFGGFPLFPQVPKFWGVG